MAFFLHDGACVDRRGFTGWAYPALSAGGSLPVFYEAVSAQRAERPVLFCHVFGLAPQRTASTTTLAQIREDSVEPCFGSRGKRKSAKSPV